MQGQQVGYAATGAVITGTGNTTVTLFTDVEHNYNSIKSLELITPGGIQQWIRNCNSYICCGSGKQCTDW